MIDTGVDGFEANAADERHSGETPLIAYRLYTPAQAMRIVPAATRRAWMDATGDRVANRCLPMVIANQCGWFLLNTHPFKVRWSGGNHADSLRIFYLEGVDPYPAESVFGHGILTFHIPYLFRTPPGYNILARGPSNWPKDGAAALEGLIEADWSAATFTMNWQITRSNHTIVFEKDEPICMIVPQRRGELEQFRPRIENIADDPETAAEYAAWAKSRRQFIGSRTLRPTDATINNYQSHYLRGTRLDGKRFADHQTGLCLQGFGAVREPSRNDPGAR